MSFKIKDNTAKVTLDIQRNASLAIRFMLDDIQSLAEPKTPKDKGNLRDNVLKTVSGLKGSIKWGQKYASIQETKKFINYTTAGTGRYYAKNAVTKMIKSPQNAMKKARLI